MYRVKITDIDDKRKIHAIKVLRSYVSYGLREAKDALDDVQAGTPFEFFTPVKRAEIESDLDAAGCTFTIGEARFATFIRALSAFFRKFRWKRKAQPKAMVWCKLGPVSVLENSGEISTLMSYAQDQAEFLGMVPLTLRSGKGTLIRETEIVSVEEL